LSKSRPFHTQLFNSNIKNFFLGSAHAREIRDTAELYAKVSAAYASHPLAAADDRNRFVDDMVFEVCSRRDGWPLPQLIEATGQMIEDLLLAEGLAHLPEVTSIETLTMDEGVALRGQLWRLNRFLSDWDRLSALWRDKVIGLASGILAELPHSLFTQAATDSDTGQPMLSSVPLIDLCGESAKVIERTMATFFDSDIADAHLFESVRERLERNLCDASGIPYERRRDSGKSVVTPTGHEVASNSELSATYLRATPLAAFFATPVPFTIPLAVRFEHTHILAGSGHGKTQTLQHLILSDLGLADRPGLVIIDSQGDMIRKLSRLAAFDPAGALAESLIIIDPSDVEHPPALNMFDVNFERLGHYSAAAREQILNGVIELYDYMFGSLLGAELTQKQSVIFRYIARLMLNIPGSTIHTLIELMTDATPYLRYIANLPPGARMFFETEFPHKSFTDTKRQIQRRLWGILENPTFERMLTAPRNRIDMFEALNSGKIVLVNTAKDFLKAERSSFLGRFFIALTLQAALERAALSERERRPAFLYIDEAADYFDSNIDDLLTQARKYHLGVVFSHQYLGQLSPALHSSIAANTSIKMAGGISDRDARSVAPDMRTTPTFINGQRKREHGTQFACHIRNHTMSALSLSIPFGSLERQERMSDQAFRKLIGDNRSRISMAAALPPPPTPARPPQIPPPPVGAAKPAPRKTSMQPKSGDDWSG
jgi:hypothetical protein